LEAVANPMNVVLGLTIFFLSRCLGSLYFINNIDDEEIKDNSRKQLFYNAIPFLVFFLLYVIVLLFKSGYAEDPVTKVISVEPYKYLNNFLAMPWALGILLVGVVLVLYGFIKSYLKPKYIRGIWPAGIGTVLTVLIVLLIAGFNNTAYYPSSDLQSSLTITNSSSSLFTLKAMSVVSIFIVPVLAYIAYVWRIMDKK
jgi:cytochrome d ubiquinol oxidase subunit II